jgi:hypothetical protein
MQLEPPANLDHPDIRGPVSGKTFGNGKGALIYGACGKAMGCGPRFDSFRGETCSTRRTVYDDDIR